MDEIQKRLADTADLCVKAYDEWRQSTSNEGARETLQNSIHELRKVSSRLEIEIALSEREQMASKPIPIPPHRSSKPHRRNRDNDRGGDSENVGNTGNDSAPQGNTNADVTNAVKKITRRRRPPAQSSSE